MNSLGFGENTADLVFDPLYFNVTNSSDGTSVSRFNGARKTTVSLNPGVGTGGGGGGGISQQQSDWAQTDPSLVNYVKNKPSLATVATTGSYIDLTNKPTLFSGAYSALTGAPTLATVATTGSYADLTGKPTLFNGAYSSLSGLPTLFSGAYSALTGAPTLATVATTGSYADLTGKPTLFNGAYSSLSGLPTLFSGAYSALTGAPTLATVATTGSYADLTGKPTLFNGAYSSLSGLPTLFSGSYSALSGAPTLATVATTGSYADLTGKPTIPPGASLTDSVTTTSSTTSASATAVKSANDNANGRVAKSGDTMTGKLIVDYGTTVGPSALFQASGIVANQSTSVIIGKSSTTRNSGTILWNHLGDGLSTNYLGLGYWAGDNVLCVTAAGTVGIGTNNPGYALDVGSFSASPCVLRVASASTTAGTTGASIRLMEASDTYGFSIENISAQRLDIVRHSASSTGTPIMSFLRDTPNVGIGKTNPGTALDVAGSITTSGTLFTPGFVDVTNSDPGDLISKRYGASDRYGIGQYTSGTVRVFTSGTFAAASICFSKAADDLRTGAATFTDMMTITSSGKVGIGVTNPGSTLSVGGDVTASGTVYAAALNLNSSVFFQNAGSVKAFLNNNVSVGPGVAFTFDGGSYNLLFTPTSSKRWTLTGVSGNYLVSARVTGTFTTTQASMTLRLNGTSSTSTTFATYNPNSLLTITLVHIVYLNTNDYIEIFNTSAGTCTEYGQFQLTGQGAVSCLQMNYINS